MSAFSNSASRSETPDGQDAGRGPTWNTPLAASLAALFSAFVLIVAFLVGSLLGDLARDQAQRDNMPVVTFDSGSETAAVEQTTTGQTTGQPAEQQTASQSNQQIGSLSETYLPGTQINILLLGSDERVSDGEPPRTDTMLLLTLDMKRRAAGMISLPRDLWLPIPSYDITSKINTAYALGEERDYPGGGPQLAKDTVSSFVGQPVHFYVQADFNGFVQFIDEIGGVSIDVPEAIHDEAYPTLDFGYQTFHLEAGRQHLDGATALKYVRTRNMDSDYERVARQQQLIRAVVDRVLTAEVFPILVTKGPQLMNTMWGSVRWDIPWPKVKEIADFAGSNDFEMRQLVLDDRYGEESYSENGAWILLPDRELIRPALRNFFDPIAMPVAEAGSSPSALTPAKLSLASDAESGAIDDNLVEPKANERILAAREARLEILNGTIYPGVAARMRQELQAIGWRVDSIGDADRSDYSRTLLINYNLDERLVREIGSQLNLSASLYALPGLLPPETTDLRIVIGEDYLASSPDDSR